MPSAELTPWTLYQRLAALLGPSGWWPADSKLEIAVGAILIQNTNWRNVDRSLANLRAATHFTPTNLAALSQADLIPLIRPSGFYQNKSRALVALMAWLQARRFDLNAIGKTPAADLRQQLLAMPGIGQETADALRLYVFNQPTFIADNYSRRLFGWLGAPANTYQQLYRRLPEVADWTLKDAQEFHGLIDNFGKTVKQKENFDDSPLAGMTLVLAH